MPARSNAAAAAEADPDADADAEESRARTASEVLLLEVLDVAERRGWADLAQRLVHERAQQHLAILQHWRASRAAVPQQASREGGTPDAGDAIEKADLEATAEALDAAIEQARQHHATLTQGPPPPRLPAVGASRAAAKRLLEGHATGMRGLPDTLQEVIDRDLCDAHRRFVTSGREQAQTWRPASMGGQVKDDHLGEPYALHPCALVGLALSGGGVRSASFVIGALQSLSRANLLRSFDVVSAVSGGSWAAGWLMAWAYRHDRGIEGVEDELAASLRGDCAPLAWMRRYIAYLAPRPGLWSGDSWALLAAYICNWLPVLWLASLSVLGVTLSLHVLTALAHSLQHTAWPGVALLLLMAPAVGLMTVLRRLTLFYREPGARIRDSPTLAKWVCGLTALGCLALSAALPLLDNWLVAPASTALAWHFNGPSFFGRAWDVFVACLLLNLGASCLAFALTLPRGQRLVDGVHRLDGVSMTPSGRLRRHDCALWREAAALALSSLIVALVAVALRRLVALDESRPGLRIAYGPLIVFAVFATADVFGSLVARRRDLDRAWVARIGGWMLGTVTAWAVLCTLALGATTLLSDPRVQQLATGVVVALPLLALLLSWPAQRQRRSVRGVIGLVALLALLCTLLPLTAAFLTRTDDGHLLPLPTLAWHWLVVILLLLPIAASDANRFSLHAIYKQGLSRTFLGASRLRPRNESVARHPQGTAADERAQFAPRRQDAATNIDPDDNPPLAWLKSRPGAAVPVLLINAAVNGISLTDREGRVPRQWPFTFSQRHSGSPVTGIGYAPTRNYYADEQRNRAARKRGVSLGGAMAVSGAAVSPTAGRATQPWRAVVLGLLNARLGMWIGNPLCAEAVARSSPRLGGLAVLREMLGLRARFGEWIHLSDGGHFENLGVYELVRRGCVRIVAIDASHDPRRDFHDLAHTIRRVHVDLGVRISRRGPWSIAHPDQAPKWPADQPPRGWMWFDIDYGFGQPQGRLLYIKPSVYDNRELPAEVLNYWRDFDDFPHESTMSQFFSERRLEVYRGLGEAIVVDALGAVLGAGPDSDAPLKVRLSQSAGSPRDR